MLVVIITITITITITIIIDSWMSATMGIRRCAWRPSARPAAARPPLPKRPAGPPAVDSCRGPAGAGRQDSPEAPVYVCAGGGGEAIPPCPPCTTFRALPSPDRRFTNGARRTGFSLPGARRHGCRGNSRAPAPALESGFRGGRTPAGPHLLRVLRDRAQHLGRHPPQRPRVPLVEHGVPLLPPHLAERPLKL